MILLLININSFTDNMLEVLGTSLYLVPHFPSEQINSAF